MHLDSSLCFPSVFIIGFDDFSVSCLVNIALGLKPKFLSQTNVHCVRAGCLATICDDANNVQVFITSIVTFQLRTTGAVASEVI